VTSTALVDLEIYDNNGNLVLQKYWDQQTFTAGTPHTFSTQWNVSASTHRGTYYVRIGVFGPGWTGLRNWNNQAATIRVQ